MCCIIHDARPIYLCAKRKIRGKVTDMEGQALTGVSIKIKGQSAGGTLTNQDGEFVLKVPWRRNIYRLVMLVLKQKK